MPDARPVRFGFILLSHFTLTAFSGMIDVLRLAGDEGDHSRPVRCTWQVIDEKLTPVRSSTGVQVLPSETLGDPARFDYLVVVGGLLHTRPPLSPALLAFIRQAAQAGVTLVGLCTGAFAMMQAGVMTNHRICVSWFHYWDFVEQFPSADPNLIVADRLYTIDRRRITCSGGRAAIDVAAEILRRHIEPAVVQKALRILLVDDADRANAAQPLPPGEAPASHPIVKRAMLLMEQHVGRQLSLTELAMRLNISVRQLERLFKEHTDTSPHRYARSLRLRTAAWLLGHSRRSIADIAMNCGFADASHLGREFRATFGMPPSAWRARTQLPDELLGQNPPSEASSPSPGPPETADSPRREPI